jgi:hypothetical protein
MILNRMIQRGWGIFSMTKCGNIMKHTIKQLIGHERLWSHRAAVMVEVGDDGKALF